MTDTKNARLPTESEIARMFVDRYKKRIRIVSDKNDWLIRRKRRWVPDLQRRIDRLVRDFIEELNSGGDARLGSRNTMRAVVELAKTDKRISVLAEGLDRDPAIVGTPTGPINLQTGKRVMLGDRLVTMSTSVAPDFEAKHPRWNTFLKEITVGDGELRDYLQRWAGYMLTGETREEAALILHGPGGNGKSIWLNTLAKIMGDYHRAATKSTFTTTRFHTHLAELAFLRAARMVTLSETDPGETWAEATFKMAVSGEPIAAREMRQNAFMFRPVFKLVAATNHLPRLRSGDDSMRRRLKIVRFDFTPSQVNRNLAVELAEEASAILAWMIRGAVKWHRKGLSHPESVLKATQVYVEMYDPFNNWIATNVAERPGQFTPTKLLTESYNRYLAERDLAPTSEVELGRRLSMRKFKPKTQISPAMGKRARGFAGIALR